MLNKIEMWLKYAYFSAEKNEKSNKANSHLFIQKICHISRLRKNSPMKQK